MEFNAKKVAAEIVTWIQEWFAANGPGCNAIVGISGGKDSSVVAALCCKALGNDRVIGVLMPNGAQHDIDVARDLCDVLRIQRYEINIQQAYDAMFGVLTEALDGVTEQTRCNLAPRLRMATLDGVAQSRNGRVANTCNLSEDWVGYSTRYGDAAGDFSPLSQLTVQEVKAIGRELGLPERFVEKVPIDGLCGKTDEDNLGFTYAVLDRYIRTGVCTDEKTKAEIDRRHRLNKFKLEMFPSYPYPDGVVYNF